MAAGQPDPDQPRLPGLCRGHAAAALRIAADTAQRPDLLVTDVIMPDMLGIELARHVRALHPGTPVVYMSGYARDVLSSQDALDDGVRLLEKPFTSDASWPASTRPLAGRHQRAGAG